MNAAIDALFRAGLRVAWLGLRVVFFVLRPNIRASVVLVRAKGRLLLVTNSYRDVPGFPGGMLKWREDPLQGARRELAEEVGLRVGDEALRFLEVFPQHKWGARIQLHVFALELDQEPLLEIDRREVVAAEFCTFDQAIAALPEFGELLQRFAAQTPGTAVESGAEDS